MPKVTIKQKINVFQYKKFNFNILKVNANAQQFNIVVTAQLVQLFATSV